MIMNYRNLIINLPEYTILPTTTIKELYEVVNN